MHEGPSGWYDDPDEPTRLRYWDGESWTERTHPKAPMPAPQPARRPVTRLRPSRDSDDGRTREPAPASAARSTTEPGPDDSPRPWSLTARRGGDRGPAERPGQDDGRVGPADDAPRAAYWQRAFAYLLDLLILGLVFCVFFTITFVSLDGMADMARAWSAAVMNATESGATPPQPPPALVTVIAIFGLMFAGLIVLYDALLLHRFGATIGCLAAGIRVRDAGARGRAPLGRLLWRSVLKHAPFVLGTQPVLQFLGFGFAVANFTWPVGNPGRLALHDAWSRTEVVRG